jgi:methionyl-tRNA formyltransferase
MKNKLKIGICSEKYVGNVLTKFCLEHTHQIEFVNSSEKIIDDNTLLINHDVNSKKFRDILIEKNIDILLLLWYPTIVKKEIIDTVNVGIINLHPSLLPHNRGMHPWYWNFIDDTPTGVTIHLIDDKIDEGNILWQKEIKKDYTDTGESIYKKSEEEIINLFKEHYGDIISNNMKPIKQNEIESTFHLKKELDKHSHIDLNKKYKAKDIINIIRARTFDDGDSSFFYDDNGDKYTIKIKIEKENG